jgi:N-acylneuraminate cytidylyltransferase
MSSNPRVLAVIPAREGSKGIPNKNILEFAGLPLIAHTLMFAKMCPEISRCIVSTDSEKIAQVAKEYEGDVPFLRPAELAQDDTPMWPVLRHALTWIEQNGTETYDLLMLLDPTSPAREPIDATNVVRMMQDNPEADGIICVSEPEFSPVWNCVIEQDGWMTNLIDTADRYDRRQDVPTVYWINGALYVWRTNFVKQEAESWRLTARNMVYQIPQPRAMSIDTQFEFDRAELMINAGMINMPWLEKVKEAL